MEKIFESIHPDVDIQREPSGSKLAARKVSELNRTADIVAVSDYSIIPELLYPDYASWTIYFARNKMVIAFTESSKYSREINSSNWYDILLREGVDYGYSDPLLDPCGYRALMVIKLAENYYNFPGLFNRFMQKVNKRNIRPKETDLIALTETGELDYHFNYKSVAERHKLKFIELPVEIDLSSFEKKDIYKSAKIEITDKSRTITKTGEPILYGITIVKNAQNKKTAEEFLKFLLSDEGRKILKENYLYPLNPPETDNKSALPDSLKSLVK
jgi:molybdate/tungstate transport system substrate-binding protein